MSALWRGHEIVERSGRWFYRDTGQAVQDQPARDCGACGLPNTEEGHDGCLGTLAGVVSACCGHGVTSAAYAILTSGKRVSGRAMLARFDPAGALFNAMAADGNVMESVVRGFQALARPPVAFTARQKEILRLPDGPKAEDER